MARDSRHGPGRLGSCCLTAALLLSVVASAGMASPAFPTDTESGMEIYGHKCAACHGEGMAGGEDAPALTGQRFVRKWAGKSLLRLSEKIRVTMPQDDPGTLRADETAALLAAILNANGIESADGRLAHSPVDRERADPPTNCIGPRFLLTHAAAGRPRSRNSRPCSRRRCASSSSFRWGRRKRPSQWRSSRDGSAPRTGTSRIRHRSLV